MIENTDNKLDKELIIVTKYFGYNFTGATLATHELAKLWCRKFNNITILTRKIGKVDNGSNFEIIECKSYRDIIEKLKKTDSKKCIYYNDDHIAFLFKLSKKKYFHTYHATWPQARWNDIQHFIKSFVFIPLYKIAIKNSIKEITVSNKYNGFVNKYNNNNCVIRNGLGKSASTQKRQSNNQNEIFKVVMVGNIDKRKYKLALKLFELIEKSNITNIQIDIYGAIINKNLAQKLFKFKFVEFKGFVSKVPIYEYDLMVHTASNENLSIAICEALKSNVPVLCFNVGGLSEVIIDNDNGLLIDNNNVLKMFEALFIIYEQKLKFSFKSRIIDQFDWEISSNKYLKEFKMENKNE